MSQLISPKKKASRGDQLSDTVRYLIELRKRLLRILLALGLVTGIASFFANDIYHFLALPILAHLGENPSLIATSVPAPFLIPLKSALVASVFIAIPYILYEVWKFIAPALYRHERKLVWMLLLTSSLLFYAGAAFAYFIVLPIVFKFFIYVAPAGVEVKPDIGQYFTFTIKLFLAFGFSFELPVAILLLVWTGITTVASLKAKRPFVIVGAFVMGMLLTPPDIISQIMLAIPLWMLFELGLWMSGWMLKRSAQTEASQ